MHVPRLLHTLMQVPRLFHRQESAGPASSSTAEMSELRAQLSMQAERLAALQALLDAREPTQEDAEPATQSSKRTRRYF